MNEQIIEPEELEPDYPDWVIVSPRGKLAVNEVVFCQEFLERRPLKYAGGEFRDISGVVAEEEIKHEVAKIIMEHIVEGVSGKVKSVTETLKLKCYTELPQACEDEIHLLNGTIRTGGAFTPEVKFCANRLNITYTPDELPPLKFLQFVSDLLAPDDVLTLQEYLGYLLIPSTKGQAMLSIIGNGGEGKSVLGTVIKEIFGDSMVEGSFRRIETDRFFRANLKGKLVFVDDDLQLQALSSTGYIKSLITVQIPTDIEYKGRQSFTEKLYARFLCFGNGTVKSLHDKSHGFSRRMIILSAKEVPTDRVVNPHLADDIVAEKSAIFNWMFAGLQKLLANNFRFTLSERTRLNAAELARDNCNIIEFMNIIILDPSVEISSADLYGGYSQWCKQNALTPIKREPFISWLKSNQSKYGIKYSTHVRSNGGNVRGFKGVALY